MTGYSTLVLASFIVYIISITSVLIYFGVAIYPDRYFFVLLIPALFIKRTRSFLLEWIPFIIIFLSYEFLRGIADHLNQTVNYSFAIWGDQTFFGPLPSNWLQQHLYRPGTLNWYDYLSTIIYFLHFVLPLSFAFLLWIKNRASFRKFVGGFLVLSYTGLLTYVAFPAAPPWLASDNGYIPHVYKILNITFQTFPEKLNIPSIYTSFDSNPVAAFPSLHAAYPLLILLFAVKFFGKKGLIFLPYVLAVWFSIVYMGEHYVTDIVGGIIYTVLSFYLVTAVDYKSLLSKLPKFKFFKKLYS